MMYLTTAARLKVEWYIKELEAKRKELLDADKDTAEDIPEWIYEVVCADIIDLTGFDENGEYSCNWPVTDNYYSDYPLSINKEQDTFEAEYLLTNSGKDKLQAYLEEAQRKQVICLAKALDTANNTPIPLPEEVLLEIQEEFKPGNRTYDFRQNIADDTVNPEFCTLVYGKDFIVSDNGRNFKTDKKRNAAYWDEIDATVERFVNEIASFSAKSFNFDGYDDGIIPDVREAVVEALKKCGAEFPFVDENM